MVWLAFSLAETLIFLLTIIQVVKGEIRPFDLLLEPAVRVCLRVYLGKIEPNVSCMFVFLCLYNSLIIFTT
jgi:hypothetical protein